jgi:hypothetical protein
MVNRELMNPTTASGTLWKGCEPKSVSKNPFCYTHNPITLSIQSLGGARSQSCGTGVADRMLNPLNAELNPICHLLVLLRDLKCMGPCIVSIFQYISNKMQRYTVYLYLETALHVSGCTSTHHQERIQLYIQHLVFVTPLLLSAAISWNRFECAVGGVRQPQHTQTGSNSSTIAADSSNGVTNTRCCRYRCMLSWWWVKVPPETCRIVSRYK